ncbi:hypothetical protein RC62_2615 [Flavobacterium aquidurense]|uniref:Uncharacterized protein n=1 Tax=Flavobacterium aquidurense TaxID=362413 RepID=A0A0Q0RN15_9FLAO|nr:hypothetical protein RC62_2615 [Flavobacterium aquidurense]
MNVKASCINLNGKQIGEYKYDTSDMKNTKWGKDNKQSIQSHDD